MRHLIYNLGDAMFKSFTIILLLAFMACKQKSKPAAAITKTDTIIPLTDTAMLPYTVPDQLRDSIEWRHKLDSFYAIKPIVSYTFDTIDPIDKLVSDLIDTNGITTTPLEFSDTTIEKWNEGNDLLYHKQILKNSRFTVEVVDPSPYTNHRREIVINGYKLRKGIALDTSVCGNDFIDLIEIESGECALLKFGAKEYLLLVGGLERCNGMGCGLRFYVLYDPAIKKAMILQLFRSKFYTGYDKKNSTPVFIDMSENYMHTPEYQCYTTTGKVYRFNHTGKVKPVLNKAGKQIEFYSWAKDFDSPLHVIRGNFLAGN